MGNAEDYDGAISHFQTALRLNPSKTFVREKIEITQALKAMTHPLELTMRSGR